MSMSERGLPPKIIKRLHQSCISCDSPSPFSYSSAVGDANNNGKSALGLSGSTGGDIDTTSITTVNLTSTNIVSQVVSSGTGQFYTLDVVEIKGFKLTGSTDFNDAILVNVNIKSGVIDNTIIGSITPNEAHFTKLTASGNVIFYGVSGQPCFRFNSVDMGVTMCDDLLVEGNLLVGGSSVKFVDKVLTLSYVYPYFNDNRDRGVDYYWHDGTTQRIGFFGFDNSKNSFTFIPNSTEGPDEVYSGDPGNLTIGNVYSPNLYIGNTGNSINSGTTSGLSITSNQFINLSSTTINVSSTNLNFTGTNISTSASNLVTNSSNISTSASNLTTIANNISTNSSNVTVIATTQSYLGNNFNIGVSGTTNIGGDTINLSSLNNLSVTASTLSVSVTNGTLAGINLGINVINALTVSGLTTNIATTNVNITPINFSLLSTSATLNSTLLGITGSVVSIGASTFNQSSVIINTTSTTNNINSNIINLAATSINLSGTFVNINTTRTLFTGSSFIVNTDTIQLDSSLNTNLSSSGSINTFSNSLNVSGANVNIGSTNLNINSTSIVTTGTTINTIGSVISLSTSSSLNLGSSGIINAIGNTINLSSSSNTSIAGPLVNLLGTTIGISGTNIIGTGTTLNLSGITSTISGRDILTLTSNTLVNINSTGTVKITGSNISLEGPVTFSNINVQNWVPYKIFDIYHTNGAGIAKAKQELISSNPTYFWEFANTLAGDINLIYDLGNIVTRDTLNKGYALSSIKVNYQIVSGSLSSATLSIIKNIINGSGVRNTSTIPVTGTLSTIPGTYYTSINIVTPSTLTFDENTNIQITFTKNINNVLKFYGMSLNYIYSPI
jgi:hypothetical protein